jgi:hypothetical protein
MYGEPLEPNRCEFEIGVFDGEISIFITDLDEQDNDDVREVMHPSFEQFWENSMENVFVTEHFTTMQQAKDWCLSIGMVFKGVSIESEVLDDSLTLSPFSRYGDNELKKMLKQSIIDEEYEKSALINEEIKKRNL